jgi:8-oxo-dGTP pyrophosphatase MutT (NUDIX family)
MSESKVRHEFSSGGVVQEGEQLLMVKVENMEGKLAWTFPKGHIEKGEKAAEAALREVEEETGYRCEIIKPFDKVQYWFKKDGQLIKKNVTWFLMKPMEKTGVHDPDEILETRWVSIEEAGTLATYKSDKQLLQKLSKDSFPPRGGRKGWGADLK